MSVKNRIWKAKDHQESARTTLLLLQFRIHKNIYVCWIINSGRVAHVSAKVVASISATMDLVIRSEKPSGHVANYNTKDPSRRPWKFYAWFRRHPVAFLFKILDDCLWSNNAYAVKIIISEPWLRFVSVALSSNLWTPMQGPTGSMISILIMYLCNMNSFDKNSIWDYLKRVDNVAPYSDATGLTRTESKSTRPAVTKQTQ